MKHPGTLIVGMGKREVYIIARRNDHSGAVRRYSAWESLLLLGSVKQNEERSDFKALDQRSGRARNRAAIAIIPL